MPSSLLTSASAADRHRAAARWLDRHRNTPGLRIVGPSFDAMTRLVDTAVQQGAVIGWSRNTLASLTRSLAEPFLADRDLVVAEPLALTGAVVDTLAACDADLGPLRPLLDQPGLPDAVLNTLTELRLARIPSRHVPEPLRTLLIAYDAILKERRLADRARVLELACDAAEPGPTLIYDVLPRWPAERELFLALVDDDSLATAPVGATRGIHHLANALGVVPNRYPVSTVGALGRVQKALFTGLQEQQHTLDDSVRLLSAPGAQRECVELVRCILNAVDEGIPFDAIGIALHRPDHYRAAVLEALERAGIPAWTTDGIPMPHPAGRALLTLLECAGDHVDANSLCTFLSLGQLDTPAPSRRWEGLLARAHATGAPERYRERLAALSRDVADDPQQAEALTHLSQTLLPLVDALATLPQRTTWTDWSDRLIALARSTLRDADTVIGPLTELRALGERSTASLRDVTRILTPRLTEQLVRNEVPRDGRVWVGHTSDILGHCFRMVLVPGLAERQFPVTIREDPLLLDAERERLPELVKNAERADAERAALQQCIGAASDRVVLSWPRIDAATGRPYVPSFYTLEVVRAATGTLPGFDELQRIASDATQAQAAWPAPTDPDRAIDDAEYDLALLGPVVRSRQVPKPGLAHYLLDTNPHLARALRARARRWTVRSWTPADGLVSPREAASAVLADRRLSAHPYSVTALERFSACPYQFFLHSLIGLRAHRPMVRVEQLDPATRGELHHAVVADVIHAMRAQDLPFHPDSRNAAHALLDTALTQRADALRERLAPSVPRIWQDAIDVLRLDLRAFLDDMVADPIWAPHHADLRIGLPHRDDADPSSITEPVSVCGFPMTGAIDMVERTAHAQLRVTDIKTGALPDSQGARIGGGRMLQPAVYAMMLESLMPDAEVVGGRLVAGSRRHAPNTVEVPLDERTLELTQTALSTIDEHIDQGMLPAAPAPDACERCDFLAVCGRSERRRLAHKAPLPTLNHLRKLP